MNLAKGTQFSQDYGVGRPGDPVGMSGMQSSNGKSAQRKFADPQEKTLESQRCKASLLEVIESQIIPRLLQALPAGNASNEQAFNAVYQPTEQEISEFAQLCLSSDEKSGMAFVQKVLEADVGNDSVFLHLMAPAARHLGLLWDQDDVDFTQVTLGLMRMHQITHQLGYEYQDGPQHAGTVRRVMLACAPGSQHIFGLAIVAEFFRKSGWQVVVEIANSALELDHAVKNEWFDLIGLSVGLTDQIPALPVLIDRLRSASHNPGVSVLLGGPAFITNSVSAQSLGADGISIDAAQAVALGASLLRTDSHRMHRQ